MPKPTATVTSEILDRVPPHSLEAERCLLGSLLLDPRVCDDVASLVKPSAFYAAAHQTLYARIVQMHDESKRIDTTLLVEQLQRTGELEAIGGPAYLATLVQSVAVAAHAVYYAQIVREKAQLRELIHAGTDLVRQAWEPGAEPTSVADAAEATLARVRDSETCIEPVTMYCAAIDACARIDAIVRRERQAGLLTGLSRFDTEVGGLFPGELVILAARPGIGKTALACQIARHVAANGRRVYFASLEMSAAELASRMMCSASGVSHNRVRTGSVNQTEMAQLTSASTELGGLAILVDDRPSLSVAEIRRAVRRAKRAGVHLIVVDYLQNLTPADQHVKRHEQVGAMTRALKALAREADVPLLCLCQFNRAAETEKGKCPQLYHLRESGSIEQDADVVLILHREDSTDASTEAIFVVAKNRNGQTCRMKGLTWHAERTEFSFEQPENYEPAFERFA